MWKEGGSGFCRPANATQAWTTSRPHPNPLLSATPSWFHPKQGGEQALDLASVAQRLGAGAYARPLDLASDAARMFSTWCACRGSGMQIGPGPGRAGCMRLGWDACVAHLVVTQRRPTPTPLPPPPAAWRPSPRAPRSARRCSRCRPPLRRCGSSSWRPSAFEAPSAPAPATHRRRPLAGGASAVPHSVYPSTLSCSVQL